jgi:hypothetical protein
MVSVPAPAPHAPLFAATSSNISLLIRQIEVVRAIPVVVRLCVRVVCLRRGFAAMAMGSVPARLGLLASIAVRYLFLNLVFGLEVTAWDGFKPAVGNVVGADIDTLQYELSDLSRTHLVKIEEETVIARS